MDAEPDSGAGVDEDGGGEQHQPDVGQEVVREEIDVDGDSEQPGDPEGRVWGKAHVKDADDAGHVGADGGIHKAGKHRHAKDFEQAGFGVTP